MAADTIIETFAGETLIMAFDYADDKPTGTTIASASLAAHEWSNGVAGTDVSATVLTSTTGDIDSDLVGFQFQALTAGKVYRIKTTTVFSDGQVQIDRVFLRCRAA